MIDQVLQFVRGGLPRVGGGGGQFVREGNCETWTRHNVICTGVLVCCVTVCFLVLRDVQKACGCGRGSNVSEAVAIQDSNARVPARILANPAMGIQKYMVGKEDRTDAKLLPQWVPRGLGPVGYHHHDGYAFRQHFVQHLRN